ncbi:MAG: acyl-[Opitutales bacterium]|nr:acyl-[acyl-carrier-protein]--UDP-N-acetylglucosamine O-acyltransferase [Opitutales bacterium]
GCSKGSKDILPFMMSDGFPATACAINKLNMQRNNFSEEEINLAFFAFKTIYRKGLSRKHAIETLAEHPQAETSRVLKSIIKFGREPTARGF